MSYIKLLLVSLIKLILSKLSFLFDHINVASPPEPIGRRQTADTGNIVLQERADYASVSASPIRPTPHRSRRPPATQPDTTSGIWYSAIVSSYPNSTTIELGLSLARDCGMPMSHGAGRGSEARLLLSGQPAEKKALRPHRAAEQNTAEIRPMHRSNIDIIRTSRRLT